MKIILDLQQEEPLGLYDSNSVFPIRHFFMRLAAIGEKKMHKCHEKSVNMKKLTLSPKKNSIYSIKQTEKCKKYVQEVAL